MGGKKDQRRSSSQEGRASRVGGNTQGSRSDHQSLAELSLNPAQGPSSPVPRQRGSNSAQAPEQTQPPQARPDPAASGPGIETVAMSVFNNYEDLELQRLIQRRWHDVDPRGRPSLEEIRTRIVQLLRLMGPRISPREGIMRLANANWNASLAVQGFIQDRRPQMERAVRRAENEAAAAAAQTPVTTAKPAPRKRPAVKQDNDDELPLPEGIDVIHVRDPRPKQSGSVPAVYHHQIRRYLLARDVRRYGAYRKYDSTFTLTCTLNSLEFQRAKGKVPDDQTAPHPDQLRWRFDKREQFPDILLQYKRTEDQENAVPPPMFWRRHLVVDIDRSPIWDFPHIPSTLSSNVEGGLLEALERLNSSTRHGDLTARAYEEDPPRNATEIEKEITRRHNRFAGRMRRFRERHCLITWSSERGGSRGLIEYIDSILPPHLKAANTTRGFRDLRKGELLEARASNFGQYPKRSKLKDPRARDEYVKHHDKALERAQQAKEQEAVEEEGSDEDSADVQDADDHGVGTSTSFDVTATTTDGRLLPATTTSEQAELQEAMWPTILHFLQLTGDLPRITAWAGRSYQDVYVDILGQLVRAMGAGSRLVGLGRWTGGFQNWREGKMGGNPFKDGK
ncbi:MAG: hypothetical protein Q9220_002278 [cf. Caloplaca sp. 1 TL-2023]